jgi:membrane glycosyltransferase
MITDDPGARTPLWGRALIMILTLATGALGSLQMWTLLHGGLESPWEPVLLTVFSISFLWLSFAFWTVMAGIVAFMTRKRTPALRQPSAADRAQKLPNRTAILAPIRNEDPARVFANLEAMLESIEALGQKHAFDVFILSDTNIPANWLNEESAWGELVERTGWQGQIFYRKRPKNTARKAGNLEDFVARWGAGYAHMLVLDADSLMAGETVIELARLMDANPDAGLVQAPVAMIGRNTVFGRLVQFAAGLYGPYFASGLAHWQLGEGTYWGHNAIIRTASFAAFCGLPHLPGKPPFGGHILSHDVVEAVLLRRGGMKVVMAPELSGSFEESPPNVLDYAKRDRRWCQGNLQHIRLLFAEGLHPIGRLHLALGIGAYLMSPLWLIFILASLADAYWKRFISEANYFPTARMLFPEWPVFDIQSAIAILTSVMVLLFLPRLFVVFMMSLDRKRVKGFGGKLKVFASATLEVALSTLVAPVMMLFQSRFVFEVLTGRDSGWNSPSRDDGQVTFRDAMRDLGPHMIAGVVVSIAAILVQPRLFLWMAPIVVAWMLAVPIVYFTSRSDIGLWLRKRGLLLTPEEAAPDPIIKRARATLGRWLKRGEPPNDAIAHVTRDARAYALHANLLTINGENFTPDQKLVAEAVKKIKAENGSGRSLSTDETMAVLFDRPTLDALYRAHLIAPTTAGA